MDLPVGEEYKTNIPISDVKIVKLIQDLEKSSLDGCLLFTLKKENKILDGNILFEAGQIVAASLETDNNVLEVSVRALKSIVQEINVSDGYFDIQKFTPDQIDLTKEMNSETLIHESNIWDIIEKASLERPTAKKTTINRDTGVSDIVSGFEQMDKGSSIDSAQKQSSDFENAFSNISSPKDDQFLSKSKKGPPPIEMLEGKESKPKSDQSPLDILDAFSTKKGPAPKDTSLLDKIPPKEPKPPPDISSKPKYDIFGDIAPKSDNKVEMPELDVSATESLPNDLKELMDSSKPPAGLSTTSTKAIESEKKGEKLELPKKWYMRKLAKMGDLKSAIKEVASLAKGKHDLLKMDESFLKEGFSMNELTEKHLKNLAYVYEIKNHATCLITGDKKSGFDILARVTDSKAKYIHQLLKSGLLETKHSEKDIMIYKTTSRWKDEYKSLL